MTMRIETRLQRLEATLAARSERESTRAVLARLQAIVALRPLAREEEHQQLAAVVDLCGGTIADVFAVVGAGRPASPSGSGPVPYWPLEYVRRCD
jgi:hypothetical protein